MTERLTGGPLPALSYAGIYLDNGERFQELLEMVERQAARLHARDAVCDDALHVAPLLEELYHLARAAQRAGLAPFDDTRQWWE